MENGPGDTADVEDLKAACEFVMANLSELERFREAYEGLTQLQVWGDGVLRRQNALIEEYNRVLAKATATLNYRYAQCVRAFQRKSE